MATAGFKRKLTAVFSADVAGYSRLMGEDEAATLTTLEAYKIQLESKLKRAPPGRQRSSFPSNPGKQRLSRPWQKVAFGTLVQLVRENSAISEIEEVIGFCTQVGLPVTLSQIGLQVVR